MAFALSGLSLLGPSGTAPRVWCYSTVDAIATVNTAQYFNGAVDLLQVRDVIIVFDTNTPTTNFVSVLSNDGTDVDVSNGTPIAETDSD